VHTPPSPPKKRGHAIAASHQSTTECTRCRTTFALSTLSVSSFFVLFLLPFSFLPLYIFSLLYIPSFLLCLLSCLSFLSLYRGADKSLAQPTSRCILFGGENISFDASINSINSINIPPIMIINRAYEHHNLLSM
jgi:hypothetical protein